VAANLFPEACIYAFEPLPEPFEDLERWARQRRMVTAFNVALGDEPGILEMLYCVDFSPASSMLQSTELMRKLYPLTKEQRPITVEVRRLDAFLAELSEPVLPDILVKVDVQGYEDRVIRGAEDTLRRAMACVLEVNLDPLFEGQPSFKELLHLLDELGHRYAGNLDQVYATDGHAMYVDALFLNRNA
jgi:FkbM family methyltransferase